jgi:hypothetical protein
VSIQIGDETITCDSTTAGTIRWTGSDFEGCNGSEWVSLTPTTLFYAIGDTGPAGGIVFYVTDGGLHGMEAAPADQSSNAEWGCRGTEIAGADGTSVGTGAQNTADILAGCNTAGIAAELADTYTLNGYDDWFLPSQDELNWMHQLNVITTFLALDGYWSSTEYTSGTNYENALYQSFGGTLGDGLGGAVPSYKSGFVSVRAVRAF